MQVAIHMGKWAQHMRAFQDGKQKGGIAMKLLTIRDMIGRTGIRCLSGSGRHFNKEKSSPRVSAGATVKPGGSAGGRDMTEQSHRLSLFQVFYG